MKVVTAEYTVRLASNPGVGDSEDRVSERPRGFGLSSVEVDRRSESLTFEGPDEQGDGATWNMARTVTVTGPDDENAVQETATITHTINNAIVANGILRATVRESDTRGVTSIDGRALEVTEGGTARYNIVLDSQPVGDADNRVTVTVGGVSGDVTVDTVTVGLPRMTIGSPRRKWRSPPPPTTTERPILP